MSKSLVADSFTNLEAKKNPNSFAVEQMHKKCLPTGSIIMWNGSSSPQGWGLCNGTTYQKLNGTGPIISPDLRGKFVLSYGQGGLNFPNNTIGAAGGEQNHTLTTGEMPSHSHTSNDNPPSLGLVQRTGVNTLTTTDTSSGELDLINAAALVIDAAGGGAAHNNMPPYYVLAYIIKL
jgi:microcystin-dependent protein